MTWFGHVRYETVSYDTHSSASSFTRILLFFSSSSSSSPTCICLLCLLLRTQPAVALLSAPVRPARGRIGHLNIAAKDA